MNQKLARYELSKTIRRPAFILALLIAVAVAIAAALEPFQRKAVQKHIAAHGQSPAAHREQAQAAAVVKGTAADDL